MANGRKKNTQLSTLNRSLKRENAQTGSEVLRSNDMSKNYLSHKKQSENSKCSYSADKVCPANRFSAVTILGKVVLLAQSS